MEQPQQKEQELEAIPRCHWHPDVETRLYCSRCGKHICTQCMVQAPVGIRCRECGRAARMPTYEVKPTYLARAVAVGGLVAVGGGILWWTINVVFGAIPYLSSLAGLAVGYAAGELISLSVNRKRGIGLAWIAGGAVVVAFLVSWELDHFNPGIFGLLFIFLGIFLAVQRVR